MLLLFLQILILLSGLCCNQEAVSQISTDIKVNKELSDWTNTFPTYLFVVHLNQIRNFNLQITEECLSLYRGEYDLDALQEPFLGNPEKGLAQIISVRWLLRKHLRE